MEREETIRLNQNLTDAIKARDELNDFIDKQQKYKVLALDTDFHEIITLASGLSLDEANAIRNKYKSGVMVEVDNEIQ
jgi:VIT1/CCC1 family predicted Fe2+/Mn2+ transporter